MLPALEIPTLKDFFLTFGRMLLYSLPFVFLRKAFPAFQDSEAESLFFGLALLAAIYPAAAKAGFSLSRAREYLSGLRSELRPAFKYFLYMTALLPVLDYAYILLLAPWDLSWTNTLLFWNDHSSNPSTLDSYLATLLSSPLWLPVYFFGICVLAPVIEEFMFRRWLYAATRRWLAASPAILLNGAAFGAMHGTDFMGTGICGLFFCWAYERTGKLETPVLMHALSNLLALAMIFSEKLFGFSL